MVLAAVLVLGIAGLIVGVVYLASPREPTYEGKTLSEWIAPFCLQTANGLDVPLGPKHLKELEPVRNAVRQIGTNALPFLIARLNHRESALHREAREFLAKKQYAALRLTSPYVSKIRAIRALANLGTAAGPAIPSLTLQLADMTLSGHAAYALSGMGAEGLRALVEQYTNVPMPLRMGIAVRILDPDNRWEDVTFFSISMRNEAHRARTNQTPADILIEGFLLIAKDVKSPFRVPAIEGVGIYGPLASNAVPALLPILNDQSPFVCQAAIRALGDIRSQPDVVVPALSDLLTSPHPGTPAAAALALRAFGYDVPIPSQTQVPRVIHPPRPVPPKERYF
jgi:HEAT repeats